MPKDTGKSTGTSRTSADVTHAMGSKWEKLCTVEAFKEDESPLVKLPPNHSCSSLKSSGKSSGKSDIARRNSRPKFKFTIDRWRIWGLRRMIDICSLVQCSIIEDTTVELLMPASTS